MEQIERIIKMEQGFDKVSSAITNLYDALNKYVDSLEALDELSDYYGSDEWKRDFADDEAGLLPSELKRGVLSEDGIWNLLTEHEELVIRMLDIVKEIFKRR